MLFMRSALVGQAVIGFSQCGGADCEVNMGRQALRERAVNTRRIDLGDRGFLYLVDDCNSLGHIVALTMKMLLNI